MIGFASSLEMLVLLGITVVIGYVGYAISNKTKIPDVVWLMLFGLMVGPVFNIMDREIFTSIAPFFSAVAILIILFDAGLNLNIYRVIRTVPKSFVLAVSNMILSIIVVGYISSFFFGFDLLSGFILGAIVGGTSSPVVISLLENIRIREPIKDVLKLESVITDPLAIVVAIALIGIASGTSIATESPLSTIIAVFSVGAVLGFISGIIWLLILDKLRGRPFDHLLTLAIAFILYAFVELSGGSGAIAALIFGLVLGNGKSFSIMLRFNKIFTISPDMKKFQNEISFFIRSFFFVFLGIMVTINIETLFIGLFIAFILLLLRVLAIRLAMFSNEYSTLEKMLLITTSPRGMSAAVLSLLPAMMNIPYSDIYSEVVLIIILVTVMYSSITNTFLSKKAESVAEKEEKNGKIKKTQRRRRAPRKVPSNK